MRRVSKVAVVACGLLAAVPALAQDDWERQVQRQLENYAKRLSGEGYHYGGFSTNGTLRDGQSERKTVRLGSNSANHLIGVCDNDCSDLDLVLYDSSGSVVASDVQDDDFPVVSVAPRRDGVYTVEIRMEECSDNPCRYGIQQFVK